MRVRVLRILDEPHCTWAHDGAAPGEYHGEGIPLRGVSFFLGYECRMRYVHEHRACYPVVEGGCQRSVPKELRTRGDIDVREHPHRARVEDEAAPEREHRNLNKDEESNLHAQSV